MESLAEYIKQLEESVQTLTERLDAAEKSKAGALALINMMRAKYIMMKKTSDDYEYWKRVAECDSLMGFKREPSNDQVKRIYEQTWEVEDKIRQEDAFIQNIEEDVFNLLLLMCQHGEKIRRDKI